jgi:hypothetical protein
MGVQVPPSAPLNCSRICQPGLGRADLRSLHDSLFNYGDSYHCLSVSHHCGAVAKRAERRHRCSFRQNGKSDRLRSARRSHGAVESHNLVRGYLHGDFDYSFRDGFAARRIKIGASRTEPLPDQISTGETGCSASGATAKMIAPGALFAIVEKLRTTGPL